MKNKTLIKDILRTIRTSLTRYLALIAMTCLGATVFIGLKTTGPNIRASLKEKTQEHNMYDFKVESYMGLREKDQDMLDRISFVDQLEYVTSEDFSLNKKDKKIQLYSASENINKYKLVEGRPLQAINEIAIDSHYKDKLGLKLGDTIRLDNKKIDRPYEDDLNFLKEDHLTIVAFVESVDYILTTRGNSSFSSSSSDFFGLVDPDNWNLKYPNYALIKSDKILGIEESSNLYKEKENNYKDILEENFNNRPEEIKLSLIKDGQEKIDQAQEEVDQAKKDLKKASSDLDKAKKELDQGQEDYEKAKDEGLEKLNDARQKIINEKKQVDQAQEKLDQGQKDYKKAKSSFDSSIKKEKAQLDQAQEDLDKAKKDLDEASGFLEEKKEELESGWQKYYQGLDQAQEKKEALLAKQKQLEKAKEDLEAQLDPSLNLEEISLLISQAEGALEDLNQKLGKINILIMDAKEKLLELNKDLEATTDPNEILEIQNKIKKLELELAQEEKNKEYLEGEIEKVSLQLEELKRAQEGILSLEEIKKSLEDINQGLLALEEGLVELEQVKNDLLKAQDDLDMAEEELSRNQSLYEKSLKEFQAGLELFEKERDKNQEKLTLVKSDLDANKKKLVLAYGQIEEAFDQLKQEENKFYDKLEEAKKDLEEGQTNYQKGLDEFKKENKKALDDIKEADEEIKKAQENLTNIKVPKYIIHGKYDDFTFNTYMDEASSMDSMSLIFTTMFYLVAILVALTTIMRMVDTERVQIGTLKALGYSKRQISSKYLFYGISSSLIGTFFGILIGYYLLMPPIFQAYTAQTNLSQVKNIFNPNYIWMVFAISILSIGLATQYSVNSALKENAANLMRPKAPQIGRKNFLENFPFIWNRLSFLQKVTFRNLSRNRIRMFMTILGVAGSSGLITMGYGIKSSVQGIGDKQFNYIFKYDIQAIYDEEAEDLEEIYTFLDDNKAEKIPIISDMATIKNKKGFYESVSIISTEKADSLDDYVRLQDRRSKEIYKLDSQGIIVSEKLAQAVDKKPGENLKLKDSNGIEHSLPISHISEHYSGHQIYMTNDFYHKLIDEGKKNNSLLIKLDQADEKELRDFNKKLRSKDSIIQTIPIYDLNDVLDDLVESLDMVVWVIIIISALLTFVVLYNLTNINVSERERELSTIKVLGFRPKESLSYIFRETFLLTILGILIGFIVGRLMHIAIVMALSPSSVLLDPQMMPLSYLYSALIVLAFTFIVMFIIDREIRKIDMVEALKSID